MQIRVEQLTIRKHHDGLLLEGNAEMIDDIWRSVSGGTERAGFYLPVAQPTTAKSQTATRTINREFTLNSISTI